MKNPVLVALDVPDLDRARHLAERLEPHVGGFKVGLELIMNEGPSAVADIAGLGLPVFADVKLHDIPNTVARAAEALARYGARWVTVHASGGKAMLQAANEGLQRGAQGSAVGALAVTVLTSLDADDLLAVGQSPAIGDQVTNLARLALQSELEGVICSPTDAPLIKSVSAELLTVTPGIRMPGDSTDDQKRVATPSLALANGADLLVVGRAITAHDPPEEAAMEIMRSIQSALG